MWKTEGEVRFVDKRLTRLARLIKLPNKQLRSSLLLFKANRSALEGCGTVMPTSRVAVIKLHRLEDSGGHS